VSVLHGTCFVSNGKKSQPVVSISKGGGSPLSKFGGLARGGKDDMEGLCIGIRTG